MGWSVITWQEVTRQPTQSLEKLSNLNLTTALSSRGYVESYDGYGGQGDILSKFGIQGLDDLEITISRERFESYISPLMKDLPDMGSPIDLKRVILFGSLLGIDYLKLSLLNTNNLSTT